ncbi:Hypothetical protein MOVI_3370 [Mesomycoplasma ovipneumoniae 14811]|uniref:Uncharacterized protein n=1 Tax=Mesomycoplasma ovipneumoniae 14811 TaxID=1188239 RepID=A0A014MHX9_9BACT|nr:Hypothetical protein MOVI_3370 [Mesomycoplasma ovipneumoniae 14811]
MKIIYVLLNLKIQDISLLHFRCHEFDSLMAKIHFLVNINTQKYRWIRVFWPKILIFIILKFRFCKKKKKNVWFKIKLCYNKPH